MRKQQGTNDMDYVDASILMEALLEFVWLWRGNEWVPSFDMTLQGPVEHHDIDVRGYFHESLRESDAVNSTIA